MSMAPWRADFQNNRILIQKTDISELGVCEVKSANIFKVIPVEELFLFWGLLFCSSIRSSSSRF